MAGILLTHSNHLYSDRKQVRKMQPYPPLHTLSCAALLRERGHQVALFDVTLARDPEKEFRAALHRYQPNLVAVIEDNFNFLTKMCLTCNRDLAFRMCAAARRAGIPAIVNGADSTDRVVAYLNAGFNSVLTGEAENAIAEIVSTPKMPQTLRGAPIENLDALPDPAWD